MLIIKMKCQTICLFVLCLVSTISCNVALVDLTEYASPDVTVPPVNPANETPKPLLTTTVSKPSSASTASPTSTITSTAAPIPTSTTPPSTSTSTTPPSTSTSTTPPSTSTSTTSATPPTSTSTTASTPTTTIPPSTSTSTTPPTTSTSTTSPPTTPAPAPITTPGPSPAPNKTEPGEWIVKDGNKTCILMKMNISANITYLTVENKNTTVILEAAVVNPNGTIVKGTCGNETQSIEIPLKLGFIRIDFALNSSKSAASAIFLNVTGLPNAKVNTSLTWNETDSQFATPVKMSYKCKKLQQIPLISTYNTTTAVISVSDVQVQAFGTDDGNNFAAAVDCEGADTPDLVPIAVGVSLGVMIIVVLVAYLIGRRRSQSRGYVSM